MTAPKWWDITVSKEKCGYSTEQMAKFLEDIGADRYVIGNEVGEGGYNHYQIRVVFKSEMPEQKMHEIFAGWGRTSPTHVRNFKYCEKEGNFYRSWEKVLRKYAGLELRYWQGQAVAAFKEQNDRQIDVIVDQRGGMGKTTLAKYMTANHMAVYCPQMADSKDYMRFAMNKGASGYVFDMPRCESLEKRKGMWSAIEQIKNGYLWDDRYQWQDEWIEPPKILVIANEEPPREYLSADRWRVWTITKWGETDILDTYYGEE